VISAWIAILGIYEGEGDEDENANKEASRGLVVGIGRGVGHDCIVQSDENTVGKVAGRNSVSPNTYAVRQAHDAMWDKGRHISNQYQRVSKVQEMNDRANTQRGVWSQMNLFKNPYVGHIGPAIESIESQT
jgi:hypothetical protein